MQNQSVGQQARYDLSVVKYLICAYVLLDSVGWSMLLPVLPGMHAQLGMNSMQSSSLSSAVSFATLVGTTFHGKLSDVVGKTQVMYFSACIQFLGYIGMIVALQKRSLFLFIFSRIAPAILKSGWIVSQALMHEYSSDFNAYVTNIGVLTSFLNAAYVIGPIIGGMLYFHLADYMIMLACLSCIFCIVTTMFLQTATKRCNLHLSEHKIAQSSDIKQKAEAVTNPNRKNLFINLLQLKFAFQLGNTFFDTYFSQQARDQFQFSTAQTGSLLGWCGILSAFSSIIILPRLTCSFGQQTHQLLPCLVMVFAIGLSTWGITTKPTCVVLASSLISMSSTLFLCIVQGLIANSIQEERKYVHEVKEATALQSCEGRGSGSDNNNSIKQDTVSSSTSMNQESVRSNYTEKHPRKSSIGSLLGYSSTVDRAARILSPIIGSALKLRFGGIGLLLYSIFVLVYCFVLLHVNELLTWQLLYIVYRSVATQGSADKNKIE